MRTLLTHGQCLVHDSIVHETEEVALPQYRAAIVAHEMMHEIPGATHLLQVAGVYVGGELVVFCEGGPERGGELGVCGDGVTGGGG